MADTQETIQPLLDAARSHREQAYCPYSKFRVGAAVLCEDGAIVPGCNVENASYGLCICAERVAIMNAVTKGYRKFKALAVCCDVKGSFQASCGACRQFIAEFGMDLDLYLVKPDGEYKKVPFSSLLPMAFTPSSLTEEREQQD